MVEDVKARVETITSGNGYAVAPRQVILIDSADEMHEQPERTVGILQDTQGCCGVLLHSSPGATAAALRQTIFETLSSHFVVDMQSEGLPMLVSEKETDTEPDTE